jgi:hypothetical protein
MVPFDFWSGPFWDTLTLMAGMVPPGSGGNHMADPTKEPQESKKDELSADELNTVTGGNGITKAIEFAQAVGAKVSGGGGSGSGGSGISEEQKDWVRAMGVDIP